MTDEQTEAMLAEWLLPVLEASDSATRPRYLHAFNAAVANHLWRNTPGDKPAWFRKWCLKSLEWLLAEATKEDFSEIAQLIDYFESGIGNPTHLALWKSFVAASNTCVGLPTFKEVRDQYNELRQMKTGALPALRDRQLRRIIGRLHLKLRRGQRGRPRR
jgi:hypothetical protein